MKSSTGTNLVSLESRRQKTWTIIILSHFSKELFGFLCVDATAENLHFTQKKEELGLFTRAEANEMIDSIKMGG